MGLWAGSPYDQPQEAGSSATSFGLGLVEAPVDGRTSADTRVSPWAPRSTLPSTGVSTSPRPKLVADEPASAVDRCDSSPKPQADPSFPSRGVPGYPPAPDERCPRASPCSAPLPGASEHQRRADLSSTQRLLKLYARVRLGSAFRVSIPPPPRGSRHVVTCWQGTDPYTKSARLGA